MPRPAYEELARRGAARPAHEGLGRRAAGLEEPSAAARGCMNALLCSVALWALVLFGSLTLPRLTLGRGVGAFGPAPVIFHHDHQKASVTMDTRLGKINMAVTDVRNNITSRELDEARDPKERAMFPDEAARFIAAAAVRHQIDDDGKMMVAEAVDAWISARGTHDGALLCPACGAVLQVEVADPETPLPPNVIQLNLKRPE